MSRIEKETGLILKLPKMDFVMRIMLSTIFWCVAMVAVAHGSYISMDTSFSVGVADGEVKARVTTRNRGDEPAHQVRLELLAMDQTFVGAAAVRLAVDQTHSDTFSLGKIFPLTGRYPVFVKTHYQDANGYQFSALLGGLNDYGQGLPSDVKIKGHEADIPVDGKTRMRFTLFNNGTSSHDIQISLHVPDEIVVTDETQTLTLRAKEEKDAAFALKNFSALENSSYAVFLAASYRDSGKYHGALGSSIVHIKAARSLFSVFSPKWVVTAMVGLFLVFLALQFKTRGKQKR
jgi:hypothetical protein